MRFIDLQVLVSFLLPDELTREVVLLKLQHLVAVVIIAFRFACSCWEFTSIVCSFRFRDSSTAK